MHTPLVISKASICIASLVAITLIGQSSPLKAQEFQPACQVNQPSGFCHSIYPGGNLVSLPAPEPLVSSASDFGTFNRPFSVNSFWNSRPRKVIFGTATIPESQYYPLVSTGSYSTTPFRATSTDEPMTVYPPAGSRGVWDPDAETYLPSVTIAHWPSETVPASGSDGHADIVDVEKGVIHSFFKLKKVDGRWVATQYAWSLLNGRGWGNGAHYFQGARASAVPSMAGVIRKHEINDGKSQYHHALALSLTYNAMSNVEQYVYPATSGDAAWLVNSGKIPTGALLMLPPTFDSASIASPALRKVVNTLKTYGAYVIDRNVGTPFYIYVENGTNFTLHQGGWSSVVAKDLHRIRAALRQVTYAKEWVNGMGIMITQLPKLNLVSMRGPWRNSATGGTTPAFNSGLQSVEFSNTTKVETAENSSGRVISGVKWAKPIAGKLYEFRVKATNGGKAYLRFWGGGAEQFNTRALGDGAAYRFYWPAVSGTPIMGVISGIGAKTVISGLLTQVTP